MWTRCTGCTEGEETSRESTGSLWLLVTAVSGDGLGQKRHTNTLDWGEIAGKDVPEGTAYE